MFSFILLFVVFIFGLLSIFYISYSTSVESTYVEQVISTSEQALSNYANYTDDVVNASDAIQKKLDNLNVSSSPEEANSFFDDIMLVSQEVESISLYDYSGNVLAKNTFYNETLTAEEIVTQGWFVSAISSPLVNAFSHIENTSTFTLSKAISVQSNTIQGVIRIQYDFSGITSMIDEARLGNGGHVYIFDNDYNTVYASGFVSDNEKKAIQNQVIGSFSFEQDGNSFYLYISTIPSTRWRVCIATNINSVRDARTNLLINSLLYSLGALVAFVILIYMISNQITKPLVRLQRQMAAVESLDFKIRRESRINGTKEVVALNNTFWTMMKRIHDLAQEVVNEQKEQNKAELKALQNQINPHFLYNTLDSIIYLIDKGENEKAQQMIVALSRFFRISISRGKNIIPVKSELEHVGYYLQIQKMRFGDSFSYQIEAEDAVYNYYVLKLILQPIVENAIVHGLGEVPEKDSFIHIKAFIDKDFLCFEITDNGYGMLPEKIDEIYATFKDKKIHKGVGLSNVYQRIRIYYGEESDVKIESSLDVGTRIIIRIPKKEATKNEE